MDLSQLLNARSLLTLRCGRSLCYATFGMPASERAKRVLLYFHGWPSSRLEAAVISREAQRQGLRIVAIDRPGSGYSDFNPRGTFESLAGDIEQLLDHLGLDSVVIMGTSGGSPYASACALLLPPHRVTSLLLLSPLAPMAGREDTLLAGVNPTSQRLYAAVRHRPWAAWVQLGVVRQIMRLPFGSKVLRLGFAPLDRQALEGNQEYAAVLRAASREGMRQGVAGPLHDMELYCARPWGLELDRIRCPTVIWNGDEDVTTPNSHAQLYAQRIPGSRLHLISGEGHISLVFNKQADILRSISQAASL